MSAADRSGTERIRRLKAVTLLKGLVTSAMDYETLQSIDFGKRSYLRQLASGAIVKENCCENQCDYTLTPFQNSSGRAFDNLQGGSGVAYGGGRWVAVGTPRSGTNILTSIDGIVWENVSGTPFAGGSSNSVAYGDGRWIAIGTAGSGTNILTSIDGIVWENVSGTPFAGGRGNSVAYGDGRWIAIGTSGSGTNILTSIDGIVWENVSGNPFGNLRFNNVAYGAGVWMAAGNNGTGKTNLIRSTDGNIWTPIPGVLFNQTYDVNAPGCVVYGNGLWLVGGSWQCVSCPYSGYNIAYSTDTYSWNPTSGSSLNNTFGSYIVQIGYGDGLWIAVGQNGSGDDGTIIYSHTICG